ncbi:MAG: 4Fe-4S dicluster domain-containing protein [Firmicutes bacterium]|nr:4Fe-4S dicluster domain-containing protein [Bacillota bacterium]
MGHIVNAKEEVYRALAERLHKNPVGAPLNETLLEILHRLYSAAEAEVGGKFPMLPMPLSKISAITGIGENELQGILESMCQKGLVLDLPRRDGVLFMLAPMVVGFFEYTFMRVGENQDMRELAGLFNRYFAHGEVRREFFGSGTKMFKALVYERLIPALVETEVLDYEKASALIRQSGGGSLGMCSCRHKAQHLGEACGAPVEDVCTSLGNSAKWLISRGLAKPASVDEMLRVLDRTEKMGLVHLGDNVMKNPAYICHCCGCCCQVLRTINETGIPAAQPSNFIPAPERESCLGCGTCAAVCHISAITMQTDGRDEIPLIDKDRCIGCGVCAGACPYEAMKMYRRPTPYTPPADKGEQFARLAKEKSRI